MKVYLNTNTGKAGHETMEICPIFKTDDTKAAPYHHTLRKAERIALALKKGGHDAKVIICPETAAELKKLNDQGRARVRQIWHLGHIKESKAKNKQAARMMRLAWDCRPRPITS